jgi:hypothetical protein
MSRARQRQRYLILFLCFCFSSAYGLAALDRTGGRTGIASFQALASAFHDNGPGWALQNFSSLLLMYQRLHASCVVLSSSRQTNRRTRIGAACGSEHLFIFRTCFRIAAAETRGTSPRSSWLYNTRHDVTHFFLLHCNFSPSFVC